jgi:hypothetical protein
MAARRPRRMATSDDWLVTCPYLCDRDCDRLGNLSVRSSEIPSCLTLPLIRDGCSVMCRKYAFLFLFLFVLKLWATSP